MSIKKAVIPVAGYGTRFLPFTKSAPKEMLPIIDRPVIQYIVEEAVDSGITDVVFISGSNKRSLEDYFDYNLELESYLKDHGKEDLLELVREASDIARFIYVRQKQPLGLGNAILQAKHVVGNEPFAVLYADDVINSDVPVLKQMMEVYQKHPGIVVGATEVPLEDVKRYGVIDGDKIEDNVYKINRFVEKPDPEEAPSRLVSSGRLILPPSIFEVIEQTKPGKGNEIQIVDAIETLIEQGTPAHACHYQGTWYDCGNKLEYIKAVVDFALARDDINGGLREYLKSKVK